MGIYWTSNIELLLYSAFVMRLLAALILVWRGMGLLDANFWRCGLYLEICSTAPYSLNICCILNYLLYHEICTVVLRPKIFSVSWNMSWNSYELIPVNVHCTVKYLMYRTRFTLPWSLICSNRQQGANSSGAPSPSFAVQLCITRWEITINYCFSTLTTWRDG